MKKLMLKIASAWAVAAMLSASAQTTATVTSQPQAVLWPTRDTTISGGGWLFTIPSNAFTITVPGQRFSVAIPQQTNFLTVTNFVRLTNSYTVTNLTLLSVSSTNVTQLTLPVYLPSLVVTGAATFKSVYVSTNTP